MRKNLVVYGLAALMYGVIGALLVTHSITLAGTSVFVIVPLAREVMGILFLVAAMLSTYGLVVKNLKVLEVARVWSSVSAFGMSGLYCYILYLFGPVGVIGALVWFYVGVLLLISPCEQGLGSEQLRALSKDMEQIEQARPKERDDDACPTC